MKNYRVQDDEHYTTMTLATSEFIRRFLLHTLPKGFHRIRHYGLFASGQKADNLARMRDLIDVAELADSNTQDDKPAQENNDDTPQPCPCCGGQMRIIEVFEPGCTPRHVPMPEGIDSS